MMLYSWKENAYILLRKSKAFVTRCCFCMCRIFPVNKNRISVCTFEGKGGYGCNPKYIVEELHKRNAAYEFVWFVNDMGKKFPDYIKRVPNTLWSRAYWLSTSKIWIDNYRKPYGTCKRKGQYYINTWHGTIGFKTFGLWRGKAFSKMAYLVSKNDSNMIDLAIIDSEWCAEVWPKGLLYRGHCLRTGAPRCDILYGDRTRYKEMFRKRHGIENNAKVVMYAPTFREGSVNGKRNVYAEDVTLEFKRLLDSLTTRFGGKWYLCLRMHPQLSQNLREYRQKQLQERVIDESGSGDMYEILAGMDAFITDYSSAAMDASFAHMPVFIYADDIEKYINERGSMLWEMSADTKSPIVNNKEMTPGIDVVLPYPIARDNDEMEENILHYDEKKYIVMMEQFEKAVGLVFDGKASKKAADKLESYIAVSGERGKNGSE